MRKIITLKFVLCFATAFTAFIFGSSSLMAQLYSSGPLITHAGQGAGGTDLSVLQDTSLNLTILGVGHQDDFNNRIADDFVVPTGGWTIDTIIFYAYQTNSQTTSPITAVNFQIWDTLPNASGATLMFGDTTTNRMTSTIFSSIWRVTQLTMTSTARPIMKQTCVISGGVTLPPGTYWIDWQSDGNSGLSGPWGPIVSIMGQNTTGNGLQSTTPGQWFPYLDDSTGTAQGFPFELRGTAALNCNANAGSDTTVCPSTPVVIGGNPAGSGSGSISYAWTPASGLSNPAIANPTATVTSTTTYSLVISDSAGCTDTSTVEITVGTVSTNLLGNDTTVCGANITLDAGAGFTNYNWSTGASSQTITVGASGTYSVQVINGSGCTMVDSIAVTIAAAPVASFSFSSAGLTVTFADLTTGSTGWSWDLGDGNTSNSQNPQHTYTASGTYSVTLIVTTPCGSDTTTQSIMVSVGIEEFDTHFDVYPNPADDKVNISWEGKSLADVKVRILTTEGKLVNDIGSIRNDGQIDISRLAAGFYFVEISSNQQRAIKKIRID